METPETPRRVLVTSSSWEGHQQKRLYYVRYSPRSCGIWHVLQDLVSCSVPRALLKFALPESPGSLHP